MKQFVIKAYDGDECRYLRQRDYPRKNLIDTSSQVLLMKRGLLSVLPNWFLVIQSKEMMGGEHSELKVFLTFH